MKIYYNQSDNARNINVDVLMQKMEASGGGLTAANVEYMEQRKKCVISTKKKYPPKEYLLKVKGISTLSLGDLHMIQAQAKNGKSTLVTIIVAAILAGKWGVLQSQLKRKKKITIFDTEQFECDTMRQYATIMRLGGMKAEDPKRLNVYNIRCMSHEQRRRFIIETVEHEKPTLVVIDGIRDMVLNINDQEGCPLFVEEMMQLASRTYCSIIGVLHNNPNEGKARGWIGTEWINKCGYSYEPQKSGNVVTVKNTVFRGAPAPEWQFTFANDGSPVCDEMAVNNAVAQYHQAKQKETEEVRKRKTQEVLGKVIEILKEKDKILSRRELVDEIVNRGIMKHTAAYEFIKEQTALSDPPFIMVSNKMVLATHHIEAKITN